MNIPNYATSGNTDLMNGNNNFRTSVETEQDIQTLASAFRAAQDEDIIKVNNAISQGLCSDVTFFAISTDWFEKAWPILSYGLPTSSTTTTTSATTTTLLSDNWKQEIGEIQNATLLPKETYDEIQNKLKKDSNNNNNKTRKSLRSSMNGVNSSNHKYTVCNTKQYIEHYVLVGSNVWLLLQSKFGYDNIEFACPCQKQHHDKIGTVVMIVINEVTHIQIPTSCRFPYEQYFNNNNMTSEYIDDDDYNNSDDDDDDDHDQYHHDTSMRGGVVPMDDDDDNDTAAADADADENEQLLSDDDLFPSLPDNDDNDNDVVVDNNDDNDTNSQMSTGSSNQAMSASNNSNPILLLPSPSYNKKDLVISPVPTRTVIIRRKYGSGLGNLGNTCFMNSTLQCLAHTEPLQKYFLTNEYQNDLNRDNPLGTGGELTIQFAKLLTEMWGFKQIIHDDNDQIPTVITTTANVVYPRNFKYTLGKYAEQFIGYDQHDSQELATYLLDALHEDCNRVTKKPYIEKPEQGDNESDEHAANKAWELHLKRDDSRVLENFMGQIKSRLQCPTCHRVSTTFDPCMFLSVPIPGADEKQVNFLYVAIDPTQRPLRLSAKVPKTATIEELLKKMDTILPQNYQVPAVEDMAVCEIWKREIFEWIDHSNDIDTKLVGNVEIVIYELRPLAEIQKIEKDLNDNDAANSSSTYTDDEESTAKSLGLREIKRPKHFKLDIASMTRLNRGEAWKDEFSKYLEVPGSFATAFNPKKGNTEERLRLYRRLIQIINTCHEKLGNNNSKEDDSSNDSSNNNNALLVGGLREINGDPDPALADVCDSSTVFRDINSKQDIAVLEFLAGKMYKDIISMERQQKELFPDGIKVEVRVRKVIQGGKPVSLAAPFALRLPTNTTVFGLREEIAFRLKRSLKTIPKNDTTDQLHSGQPTAEDVPSSNGFSNKHHFDKDFGTPESWILRQVPLYYERKNKNGCNFLYAKQLGSIAWPGTEVDGSRSSPFAQPDQEEEKALVSDLVGNDGVICMDWPTDLLLDSFDTDEYETVDDYAETTDDKKSAITVLDCIDKFCQTEQLEESEQWYCNRCKDHVCAWKQFHIYRSPPHLIVHLKRFQVSARTHRRQKIESFIDFPLVGLDLTKHVLHWSEAEKPIYDLYAVSNHYGGLGGGHYTAHALNEGGTWCHYDDSRISTLDDSSEVVSAAAYVLYYRRRDVPIDHNFEIFVPTPENNIITTTPAVIRDGYVNIKKTDNNNVGFESSNAAMVQDEDDAMDETGSRSTSPASVLQDDYQFNHVDDDDLNDGHSDNLPPLQ